MNFSVRIERRAERELRRTDQATLLRIIAAIDALVGDPYAGPALRGQWRGFRRIRVGDYRIVYRVNVEQSQIEVLHVRHRREAYRRP